MSSKDFESVAWAKDFRGSIIKVGDTVLYPRQMGQTLEIQEGTVLDIKAVTRKRRVRPDGWNYNTHDRDDWIESTYLETKFKIQPTRSSRYDRGAFKKDWITGNEYQTKAVWVLKGMNVVKA